MAAARRVAEGEFLEHALVHGHDYGTLKAEVLDRLRQGRDVLLNVDVQGAATVRQLAPEAVLIFLSPGSEAELVRRLSERKTESPEGLKLRIATARRELQRMGEFDYCVVNRDLALEATVDQIIAIIAAEHSRVHPRQELLSARGSILHRHRPRHHRRTMWGRWRRGAWSCLGRLGTPARRGWRGRH